MPEDKSTHSDKQAAHTLQHAAHYAKNTYICWVGTQCAVALQCLWRMNLNDRYKKPKPLLRKHVQVFLLNEQEMEAFNAYCRRFKVENRSKLMRELLFREILFRIEDEHPTLFTDEEMDRMRLR